MSDDSDSPAATPAALGYRWPAEWEPHVATWLSWPRRKATWPGKFGPVPAVWSALARTLAEFEPVHILCGGAAVMAEAQRMVGSVPNVTLHDVPTNDAWIRDHGPIFLGGRGLPPALVDWQYNAWGGKYPPFDSDNAVPGRIAQITGIRRFAVDMILEGGAIDGDGEGSVLTTEACLLNPNRNPQLGRKEIEQYLARYLGTRKVLWLGSGVQGDDTDGHIDELARYVAPGKIVAAWEDRPDDVNYRALQDNFARLQAMTDAAGRKLEVIPLAMPGAIYHDGIRLPASYMNFYIANGVVIVPEFGDPADRAACEILQSLFPDRQMRPLAARDLVWGLGGFHCITQQQPAAG